MSNSKSGGDDQNMGPKEDEQLRAELSAAVDGRYTVGNRVGSGAAGAVYELTGATSAVKRVAKILRPAMRNNTDLRESFLREADRVAPLGHPNLVHIYESSREPPFYIMELVAGEELDEAFAELIGRSPEGEWVRKLRDVFVELADVLAYLHSPEGKEAVLHLDIKPANILVRTDHRGDLHPVLLDFGVAKTEEELAPTSTGSLVPAIGTFHMWPKKYVAMLERMTDEGRAVFKIKRDQLDESLDLHLLGVTIRMVMERAGVAPNALPHTWTLDAKAEFEYLVHVVEKLNLDRDNVGHFGSAEELRLSLRRLQLRASRAAHRLQSGFLRVPRHTLSTFGRRVRKIVDEPRFQRLRNIHQLSLTYLVYPGATHTRFEHSLGCFQNSLEYLDAIAGPNGHPRFRSEVTDDELLATALFALLHDVGHYPFGHQADFGDSLPLHEERTLGLIQGELGDAVEREFGGLVRSALNRISLRVTGRVLGHLPAELRAEDEMGESHSHYKVLEGVVDGTFDVDKLDYVWRDSWHIGVPYGQPVDRDRLIRALRVHYEEGVPHLLVSDKGRACAEALVFARYLLFSEVYWNHCVRSYTATLRAAMHSLSEADLAAHQWDSDLEFLKFLFAHPRTNWLEPVVTRHQPYRRALVLRQVEPEEKKPFAALEKTVRNRDEDTIRELRDVLAGVLGKKPKDFKDHEVVIDVPPAVTNVENIRIIPDTGGRPGNAGPIYDAIASQFDLMARKARVFVHPRHTEGVDTVHLHREMRAELLKLFP